MESSDRLRTTFVLFAVMGAVFSWPGRARGQNLPPVADAGLPRYAGTDPVQLDGTASYDPDNSGALTYTWTQVSGRHVSVSGADTATPTVHGFMQTDNIQQCEFELVVSDGELTSLPDIVKIVIVAESRPPAEPVV